MDSYRTPWPMLWLSSRGITSLSSPPSIFSCLPIRAAGIRALQASGINFVWSAIVCTKPGAAWIIAGDCGWYVGPVSRRTSWQDAAAVAGWPTGPRLSSLSSLGGSTWPMTPQPPLSSLSARPCGRTWRSAFKLGLLGFWPLISLSEMSGRCSNALLGVCTAPHSRNSFLFYRSILFIAITQSSSAEC